jgi:hypothetical protein
LGARVSNRFALALISLALDELDAAQVGRRRARQAIGDGSGASPDMDGRLVAVDVPRLAISIAATRSLVAAEARHPLVAKTIARGGPPEMQKRSPPGCTLSAQSRGP